MRRAKGEEDSPEHGPVIDQRESPKGPERLLNSCRSQASLSARSSIMRCKTRRLRQRVTYRLPSSKVEGRQSCEFFAPCESNLSGKAIAEIFLLRADWWRVVPEDKIK